MPRSHSDSVCDIIIVGGGLTGASLAVALRHSGLRITVVEPFHFNSDQQPSYDERTIALTWNARQIYSATGIWDDVQTAAEPIQNIHISNRGHFGTTHLDSRHAGTEALGYVVPARILGRVLWECMSDSENILIACPASATTMEQSADACGVNIEQDGQIRKITSKMVLLCDGGRSDLSIQAGLVSDRKEYPQSAVLCIATVSQLHRGRAYERFTAEGPLALLPLSSEPGTPAGHSRYAVVWTTENQQLASRLSLADDEFIQSLQQVFGDRAGLFSRPSARKSYPLVKTTLDSPANGRFLALGNAAHTVHPVAGQGFNLGLRDVACLAELIIESSPDQLGNDAFMKRYVAARKRDTRKVDIFTHSLIKLFSNENGPLSLLRNLGLKWVEYNPAAKRFLLKRTMGMHDQTSKLSTGIPLTIPDRTAAESD